MIKRARCSRILEMVEQELDEINKIKDVSVSIRKFNKLFYPKPKHFTARSVVRLRKKLKVSQAVLAFLTNNSESTIRQWESGLKKPGGANCRLLQILEQKGLGALRINL